MNEHDSEIIRSILTQAGFNFTENELDADILLLNTCSVRESAHRKIFGKIHRVRHEKGGLPLIVGVLGCMATGLKDELIKDKGFAIDFIVGPDNYKNLPTTINKVVESHEKLSDIKFYKNETYSEIVAERDASINAWIAIMRGCDNFCSFCIVPLTRGRERSLNKDSIIKEAKSLSSKGYQQITLLGQNVNSYKDGEADFCKLLEELVKVKDIERIRFVAPHPKDFPEKLIDVIAKNKKICKSIHLPLQAGNNRILDLMNRKYTKEEFISLADKMRNKIPNLVLTTDIIVGFPTETEEEFNDTLYVVEKVGFDSAFIFKYSERKNTKAAKELKDDISEEEKTKRIVKLQDLQGKISLKKNEAEIGKTYTILIENMNKTKEPCLYIGKNDGNKLITFRSSKKYELGSFIDVKVNHGSPHNLRGEEVL